MSNGRRGIKIDYPKSARKSTASRDGVLRRSVQIQVFEGTTAGIWTVTSETPTRNVAGKLVWNIQCDHGHVISIEHSLLEYGVVPAQCAQCVAEEQASAAALKAHERRVLAECLADQQHARQQAEQEQQEGNSNA
jgi:hypothetical protein